jgi:hypothetical protein
MCEQVAELVNTSLKVVLIQTSEGTAAARTTKLSMNYISDTATKYSMYIVSTGSRKLRLTT